MPDLFKQRIPGKKGCSKGGFKEKPLEQIIPKDIKFTLLKCPHCFSSNLSAGPCWKSVPSAQTFYCHSCEKKIIVEENNRDYGTIQKDKQYYVASYTKIYKSIEEWKDHKK